jgi:molybdenum cofactor cytidylyltransferase
VRDIEGVVLAAGLSTRSGTFKMALPLGDKTAVERAIAGMYEITRRILVVAGWQAERIEALLAPYARVEIVRNEGFRDGMFSSVQAGLAQVRAPRVFLLPGDHPLIGPEIYLQMLAEEAEIVIPTCEGKKGHPVLLSGNLIPEILALPVDATLREYIAARGYTTVEVGDRGILMDIDTPEDYQAALAALRRGHEPL